MRVQKNQIRQVRVKGQDIAALVLEVGKSKTVLYNFGTGRLVTIPSHKAKKRKVAKPVAAPTVTEVHGPEAVELPIVG